MPPTESYELKCERCVAYCKGECRCAFPTIIGEDLTARWPLVKPEDWCLMFTPPSEDLDDDFLSDECDAQSH